MSNPDVLREELKIVLLGKSGVGKTRLVTRFFTEVLNESETALDVSIFAPIERPGEKLHKELRLLIFLRGRKKKRENNDTLFSFWLLHFVVTFRDLRKGHRVHDTNSSCSSRNVVVFAERVVIHLVKQREERRYFAQLLSHSLLSLSSASA